MNYEDMLEEAFKKIVKRDFQSRFQIPQIEAEVQPNRIIIKNFKKIAEYLRRDEKHIARYLLKNTASSGEISGEYLVINKKIKVEVVQKKLEDYIKSFVICKVCGQPDTRLIKEGRTYMINCDACGARYAIKE
ncbi:MAG: translation initiation factor IF-2 subunit beta [Candidatus Aenigmatarchaeota archaeon]